jgi:hypothetical protein
MSIELMLCRRSIVSSTAFIFPIHKSGKILGLPDPGLADAVGICRAGSDELALAEGFILSEKDVDRGAGFEISTVGDVRCIFSSFA